MTIDKTLEYINTPNEERANRLCVSLSDIHLTDGTVGSQNLSIKTWDAFYDRILARCLGNDIKELTFILDGDVVDMIRTEKWAKNKIYPWQREKKEEFSKIVNELVRDIVGKKHKLFFDWLKKLPIKLKDAAGVEAETIIILGNHDKELFCDQEALTYFYEHGLGQKISNISDEKRRMIGRMYGDENMFVDKLTAPYLPFYYGDTGFRFFTTHGQWRDIDNSRKVRAKDGFPGWSVKDGWQDAVWKKLKFSPFFLPCFGDTVAAGVLSTFIYKTKAQLKNHEHDERLMTILDELDLYRPTYKAIARIVEEIKSMRKRKCNADTINIIENTLYECVMEWLSWPFTYESASLSMCIKLKLVKFILILMKIFNKKLSLQLLEQLIKKFMPTASNDITHSKMLKFPAFIPEYEHYGFQIHGEGHTHIPWEEEPNFGRDKPSSYINFGTWRDQIVARKTGGYRRRSILRSFFILDLQGVKEGNRSLNYYTDDIIIWSDKSDSFSQNSEHFNSV